MATSNLIPRQFTDAGKASTSRQKPQLYAQQPYRPPTSTGGFAAPTASTGGGGGGGLVLSGGTFDQSDIGSMAGGDVYDPRTGTLNRTGAQKGTDAGEALNALARVTGMPLLGSSNSSGSGGGSGSGMALPPVQMPDTSAATGAAFARGKDQAGQTARAALTALQEEMAGRNMAGSGQEAMATADVINRAGAGVNELTREQAIKDAQFANQRGIEQYRGNITQRGQNINVQQENQRRASQAMEGLLSVMGGMLY